MVAFSDLKGAAFNYALHKNLRKLAPEVKDLNQEFEKGRIALAEKMCKRDEAGKPIIEANQYVIENKAVFDDALAAFIKETGYDELMEKPSEFDVHCIDEKDIPAEITAAQMGMIFSMVREEEAEDIPVGQKF